MKQTIFRELNGLYSLKRPSFKSLPSKQYKKMEILALTFYQHIFESELHMQPSNPLVIQYFNTLSQHPVKLQQQYESSEKEHINQQKSVTKQQQIKLQYHNIFVTLNNKKTDVMDFVGCIICLLGDFIFLKQNQQREAENQNNSLTLFFQRLTSMKMELKQYLYLLYTRLTIHLDISIVTVRNIFKRYIKITLKTGTFDFNVKMKFMQQWQVIKKSLKNPKNLVGDNRQIKKKRNQLFDNSYVSQYQAILKDNSSQIYKEQKQNDYCVTTRAQQNKDKQQLRYTDQITEHSCKNSIFQGFAAKQNISSDHTKLTQLRYSIDSLKKSDSSRAYYLPNLKKFCSKKSKMTDKSVPKTDHRSLVYWQKQVKSIKSNLLKNSYQTNSYSSLNKSDYLPVNSAVRPNNPVKKDDWSLEYTQRVSNLAKLLPNLHNNQKILQSLKTQQNIIETKTSKQVSDKQIASKQLSLNLNAISNQQTCNKIMEREIVLSSINLGQTNTCLWLHSSHSAAQDTNNMINLLDQQRSQQKKRMKLAHKSGQLKKQMYKFITETYAKQEEC